jgi:hypothetical protein
MREEGEENCKEGEGGRREERGGRGEEGRVHPFVCTRVYSIFGFYNCSHARYVVKEERREENCEEGRRSRERTERRGEEGGKGGRREKPNPS